MNNSNERTQDSMEANFVTKPHDTFILCFPNCISSSTRFVVSNIETDELVPLCFPNCKEVWNVLKQINEMGARKVVAMLEDGSTIPFEESAQYKARF